MKIGALVLAAGLALPALSASAQSVTLAGDELRQAISGKTVYLKISGFELPIVYSANGRMKGTMGRSHEFLARRWRFTEASGGWRTTSFARNGRVGWTASLIATNLRSTAAK